MGKYIQPFACNECMEFIEGQTKEEHRKKCKGKPSIFDAAPVKEPVKPAEPEPARVVPVQEKTPEEEPKALTQVERNKRYRQGNEEYRRKHREYMREYMKAKRAKARE